MRYLLKHLAVPFIAVVMSFPAFADNAPTLPQSLAPSSATTAATTPSTQAVNINTADAQTLVNAHLKGIGKKRAADIVAWRSQHGAFKSIDDLKNIKGIGQKFIDANRDRLTVS